MLFSSVNQGVNGNEEPILATRGQKGFTIQLCEMFADMICVRIDCWQCRREAPLAALVGSFESLSVNMDDPEEWGDTDVAGGTRECAFSPSPGTLPN